MMASDNQFRISFFSSSSSEAENLHPRNGKEPTKRRDAWNGRKHVARGRKMSEHLGMNRVRGFGRGKAEDRACQPASFLSNSKPLPAQIRWSFSEDIPSPRLPSLFQSLTHIQYLAFSTLISVKQLI